ncbi:MAG TPA: hypothetical protein GXZ24_03650 [Firmicutes bacterium]|nr:hypothetical protein [Bacillota bacterium]
MSGPKPDKLDNLIAQAFREEAQKVAVPSSTLLWDNIQQQLENLELRKSRGEQQPKLPDSGEIPSSKKRKKAKTRKKGSSYLAGLAVVACLFLALFFAASPKGSGLRNYFPQFLPPIQKDQVQELATKGQGINDSPGESISDMDKSKALNPPASVRTSPQGGQDIADDQSYRLFKGNNETLAGHPPELPERSDGRSRTFAEIAGVETGKGAREIYWPEEEAFLNSLESFGRKTDSAIIYFEDPPEGYIFKAGVITEIDHCPQNIYQEFSNKEGLRLSLNQIFYKEETAVRQALETAKESGTFFAEPSFEGYLVHTPEGLATLTWKNGSTIVTLSGQVGEEALLKNYLDLLTNY